MYQNLKKKTEGFTIIEVLIVLAIAGLIMLIVFLAVPALQRNSRNTQRRNDAAALVGAVNEFVSSNNGNRVASGPGWTNAQAAILGNAKTRLLTSIDLADMAAYTEALGTGGTAFPATPVDSTNLSKGILLTGTKCDYPDASNPAIYHLKLVGSKGIAILFAVEASNGSPVAQCVDG